MSQEVTRTIDDMGRINLPKELRKLLGWSLGDEVNLRIEGDKIVVSLLKHNGGPMAINPKAQ